MSKAEKRELERSWSSMAEAHKTFGLQEPSTLFKIIGDLKRLLFYFLLLSINI
jgi:hypothetical protein